MSVSVLRVEEQRTGSVSLRALWFGLLAGPLAWALQELIGYGFAARACGPRGPGPIPMAPGVGIGEMVVSGAAMVLAAAGLVAATLCWRRVTRRESNGESPLVAGDERNAFMALGGVVVGCFFLFAVLMNAAGYFLIPPCV